MQMGGVGQTSGKHMCVRETTSINQWQRIRARDHMAKGSKHQCKIARIKCEEMAFHSNGENSMKKLAGGPTCQ